MKPFIIDAFRDGKYVLPFQVEGQQRKSLGSIFKDAQVKRYGLPASHSLEATWLFRLEFDTGVVVDFSSACTMVGGWQEIGSLNINFSVSPGDFRVGDLMMADVHDFYVKSFERLVYMEDGIYAECGISMKSHGGAEICVVAGTSPGSVSILAPFSFEKFAPEFELNRYMRHAM